ncbi:MAG: response regulator [Elusimicrobiota bacterium]|nr:response regulator [Elusimicrobiota bacterium]
MARILVVDDDLLVRELLTTVLGDAGHSVAQAETGEAALAALRKERFDLLFLDRGLPGLSGLEVLVMIRKEPAWKRMKVLMCTGAGMLADAQDAMAAGADDYVVKPLEVARLLEKTARHLAALPPAPPEEPGGGLMGPLKKLFRPS